MKGRKRKGRTPILAAGGIVVRGASEPVIAVVQDRKYGNWVLPKGKLNQNETAVAAARREVLEEVGHKVHMGEFLGTISYDVGGRAKVVQFWLMRAIGGPVGPLMRDVKAVEWLPLENAIEKLTHSREQEFLRAVGPVALEAVERAAREDRSVTPSAPTSIRETDEYSGGTDLADRAGQFPGDDDNTSADRSARHNAGEKIRTWLRRIFLGHA